MTCVDNNVRQLNKEFKKWDTQVMKNNRMAIQVLTPTKTPTKQQKSPVKRNRQVEVVKDSPAKRRSPDVDDEEMFAPFDDFHVGEAALMDAELSQECTTLMEEEEEEEDDASTEVVDSVLKHFSPALIQELSELDFCKLWELFRIADYLAGRDRKQFKRMLQTLEMRTVQLDAHDVTRFVEVFLPMDLRASYITLNPEDLVLIQADKSKFLYEYGLVPTRKSIESKFRLHPESPRRLKSHRAARHYGQNRFLILRVSEMFRGRLQLRSFHLGAFRYEFLYCKEATRYDQSDRFIYFATHGPALPVVTMSMFRQWHCPPALNGKSMLGKYVARTDLAFSRTETVECDAPVIVRRIGDAVNSQNVIMNDGCSAISAEYMARVKKQLKLDELPCAVQARFGGAKGVWYMDKVRDPATCWIELTDSQVKYKSPQGMSPDDARLKLEVIKHAKDNGPGRANLHYMRVMVANGVPVRVIAALAKEQFDNISQLMQRTEKSDVEAIRKMLIKKLMWIKFRDEDTWGERREWGERQQLTQMAEEALGMVEAGFEPSSEPYLFQLLKQVLLSSSMRLSVEVEKSRTFIVIAPAENNPLREGECFLAPSEVGVVLGDVLLTRSPCNLATDVRKMRAVDAPELMHFRDVLVLPVVGKRPAASELSGGDYDGDTVWCSWDERLTVHFTNAPWNPIPTTVEQSLIQHPQGAQLVQHQNDLNTSIFQFCRRGKSATLGMFSYFCDAFTEHHSFSHPLSIELGYICQKLVDAAKGGWSLSPHASNRYLSIKDAYPKLEPQETIVGKAIYSVLEREHKRLAQHLGKIIKAAKSTLDPDLYTPQQCIRDAISLDDPSHALADALRALHKDMYHMEEAYRNMFNSLKKDRHVKLTKHDRSQRIDQGIRDMEQTYQSYRVDNILRLALPQHLSAEDLKASVAYEKTLDHSKSFASNYCWIMCPSVLCKLKAHQVAKRSGRQHAYFATKKFL